MSNDRIQTIMTRLLRQFRSIIFVLESTWRFAIILLRSFYTQPRKTAGPFIIPLLEPPT